MMFKFCSLFSGSSGNSSLVQSDNTKILVDAGGSARKIENALNSLSISPNTIDAIIISHEHTDHTNGVGLISKKYNIPVYANKETWDAMENQKSKIDDNNINYFDFKKFNIGELEILPFSIPHDAANPCGFNIFYDNKKISIATDLGHITEDIMNKLDNSSFILLESNYDSNILKCSRYPYLLKQRISGPNGHLSNEDAGKIISSLANHGLNTAMLGHLSRENNFPELAYKTIVEQMIENNINQENFNIKFADRYNISPIIDIC